jgi:hypothetical protein
MDHPKSSDRVNGRLSLADHNFELQFANIFLQAFFFDRREAFGTTFQAEGRKVVSGGRFGLK